MIVDALEVSTTKESHQSVIVDGFRFDFIYNSYIDAWFVSIFKNEELVYGSIKMIPAVDLFKNLEELGELIVFAPGPLKRADLFSARVVYFPKAKNEL